MSNRLFDKKKEDYTKSEFTKTKELVSFDKWAFDEIDKRSDELAKIAVNIWQW